MKNKILALGLVLALVAVMLMPMVVSAANPATGGTTVQGDIGTVYTITPPSTITLGPFAAAQAYTDTGKTITVSTNDSTMSKCGIVVSNSRTNAKGFLTLGGTDVALDELTNALTVKGGGLGSYTSLTADQTLRVSTTAIAIANISDFAVSQTVASGDLTKTAGTYSLTMTFTATFAP